MSSAWLVASRQSALEQSRRSRQSVDKVQNPKRQQAIQSPFLPAGFEGQNQRGEKERADRKQRALKPPRGWIDRGREEEHDDGEQTEKVPQWPEKAREIAKREPL